MAITKQTTNNCGQNFQPAAAKTRLHIFIASIHFKCQVLKDLNNVFPVVLMVCHDRGVFRISSIRMVAFCVHHQWNTLFWENKYLNKNSCDKHWQILLFCLYMIILICLYVIVFCRLTFLFLFLHCWHEVKTVCELSV